MGVSVCMSMCGYVYPPRCGFVQMGKGELV